MLFILWSPRIFSNTFDCALSNGIPTVLSDLFNVGIPFLALFNHSIISTTSCIQSISG